MPAAWLSENQTRSKRSRFGPWSEPKRSPCRARTRKMRKAEVKRGSRRRCAVERQTKAQDTLRIIEITTVAVRSRPGVADLYTDNRKDHRRIKLIARIQNFRCRQPASRFARKTFTVLLELSPAPVPDDQ